MKNPNALIAMAQVSQNANNPFFVFCEYIKYCIHVNSSDIMTIEEVRNAVGLEFGIYLPRNVALKCISILQRGKEIEYKNHQIKRIGNFDATSFEAFRTGYRITESALIHSLIDYVAKYGKLWDEEYARKMLIGVLDQNGLAYDVFIKNSTSNPHAILDQAADYEDFLPDDDEMEHDDPESQPLYTDSLYVGKFVKEILIGNSIQKEYLNKVCEGLMICSGAYQIPSASADITTTQQIKGTIFFFDTKLLLRFIGCAGEAAVGAAKELVQLIQSLGGNICYYPQTLEEMNSAFDNAIHKLSQGYLPKDDEMRLYAASVKSSIPVITAKKAGLVGELTRANINLRQLDTYTESERIRFGFSKDDLQQFMQSKLSWDSKTIENDALSIWETHMRRHGNYNDYCGAQEKLPVFVTTNTRLIWIALKFREERASISSISGWKSNRLPVITDMRLTCRLWSPASQGERLSLLYLTANAVAAQRPTQRYINTIRELAIEIGKEVPEYSGISLTEYFDDNVTDTILANTLGSAENLDIGTFASSLAELSEWKAKEEENRTVEARKELDDIKGRYDAQQQDIIEGAVEKNKNKLGIDRLWLYLILWWPVLATIIFAGVSALISYLCGNWHILWAIVIPISVALIEKFSTSKFIKKLIGKSAIPKLERAFERRITNNLGKAELPYKDKIISRIKEETELLVKCKSFLDK